MIAFFLRVYKLNDIAIEIDEMLSVEWFMRNDFIYLLTHNTELNNHPLNSIFAYLMSYGNELAFTLRWHSVIFGVLTIAFLLRLVREWFDVKHSLLAGFLVTTSAYHVPISQIARGYAMSIGFTVMGVYFLYRLLGSDLHGTQNLEAKWYWFGFIACSILNIYSHLYGVMAVGVLGVMGIVFIFNQYRNEQGIKSIIPSVTLKSPIMLIFGIMIIYSGALILYMPMLSDTLAIVGQQNRFREKDVSHVEVQTPLQQITKPIYATIRRFSITAQNRRVRVMDSTFHVSRLDLISLLADSEFGFYFCVISILLGFIFSWHRFRWQTFYLVIWLVLPFMVQFVADWIIPGSYYRGRFLAFVYPAYLLLMIRGWFGFTHAINKKIGMIIARGFISIFIIINLAWLTSYYASAKQAGWQTIADTITQNRRANDMILCGQRAMTHCNSDPNVRTRLFVEEVDKLINTDFICPKSESQNFALTNERMKQDGRVWLIMPYLKQNQIDDLAQTISHESYWLTGEPPFDRTGLILFDSQETLTDNLTDMLQFRSQSALILLEREHSYITLAQIYLYQQKFSATENTLNQAMTYPPSHEQTSQELDRLTKQLEFAQQAEQAIAKIPKNVRHVNRIFRMEHQSTNLACSNVARLVAYHINKQALLPNDTLLVTLYWLPLTYIEHELASFVNLTDVRANVLAKANSIPNWQPGELAVENYTFHLENDVSTPYALKLEAGLFDIEGSQFIPTFDKNGEPIHTPIAKLAIKTKHADSIDAPQQFEALFDQAIKLEWHTFVSEPPSLTLHWHMQKTVNEDYTLFIHLIDEQGTLVGQIDGQPFNGNYPTSWWQKGERIIDLYPLPSMPKGKYQIMIGWYRLADGMRLPVVSGIGNVVRHNAVLIENEAWYGD